VSRLLSGGSTNRPSVEYVALLIASRFLPMSRASSASHVVTVLPSSSIATDSTLAGPTPWLAISQVKPGLSPLS